MDAFDADVLIYASSPRTDPARRLADLIFAAPAPDETVRCVGSVLLFPEVLTKPIRIGDEGEIRRLRMLLARLELFEVNAEIARHAAELRATYRLDTPDAVHLATAAVAGADRFITNNRKDFPKSIVEVDIVYPDEL